MLSHTSHTRYPRTGETSRGTFRPISVLWPVPDYSTATAGRPMCAAHTLKPSPPGPHIVAVAKPLPNHRLRHDAAIARRLVCFLFCFTHIRKGNSSMTTTPFVVGNQQPIMASEACNGKGAPLTFCCCHIGEVYASPKRRFEKK